MDGPLQKELPGFHGWQGYWDAFFAGDDVFCGHVLGFKGLERLVVRRKRPGRRLFPGRDQRRRPGHDVPLPKLGCYAH